MAHAAAKRGLITVMGGPHLTIMPWSRWSAARRVRRLRLQGRGRIAFLELINTAGSGCEPGIIPGIHFKRNGEIIASPESPADPGPGRAALPGARPLQDRPLHQPATARRRAGPARTQLHNPDQPRLPVQVHLLLQAGHRRHVAARSVESVVQEWKWLVHGLGATEIGVTDDIWNLKLPRQELCRRLIAEGLNTVPWVTVHGMKVNHTDLELFQLMKAAGCKRVGFGVENGDEAMLRNVIRKGQTLDQVREAFANAEACRLRRWASSSSACRATTKRRWRRRSNALELDPAGELHAGGSLPGTVMYDQIKEGGQVFADNWGDFCHPDQKGAFHDERGLRPRSVVKKWRRRTGASISTGPSVLEKMMFKENWTNLPGTFAQIKRFFIGARTRRRRRRRWRLRQIETSAEVRVGSTLLGEDDMDIATISRLLLVVPHRA